MKKLLLLLPGMTYYTHLIYKNNVFWFMLTLIKSKA